ncbi:STAS domain-containing protein [Nocardia sp. AG03]|uniref:STAS domain-containing protein n=1 Tax=Nocardia sp. AG03 TaxID=3025312 RepID=UPI002418A889|nr:STAS domain-containing protein [Nocardia sp. AG03]
MYTTTRHPRRWSSFVAPEISEQPLRVHADTRYCAGVAILQFHGPVDAYSLPRFRRLLDSAIGATAHENGRQLIIDLTDVEFLSLRAVLALAELARQGNRRRVAIAVIDAEPYATAGRVVEIAGLTEYLSIYPDLDEALAATGNGVPRPREIIVQHGLARLRPRRRQRLRSVPIIRR